MYTGNAYSHNLPWKGYTRMMFMVSVANVLEAQCTLLCFAMLADEVKPSGLQVEMQQRCTHETGASTQAQTPVNRQAIPVCAP
jgi:hypothetical protein